MNRDNWDGYSDVLDNQEFDVEDRVNALASNAETIRIAVGYFYLGGFDLLKESLQQAKRIELVIGTTTSQETVDELERGVSGKLDELNKDSSTEGIKRLYQLIQSDIVDVRIYDKEQFHPKLYLFKEGKNSVDLGRALVGSSNLSRSGLKNNIELTVENKETQTVRYLDDWFTNLWRGAEEFDTELMTEEIEESQFGDVVCGNKNEPDEPVEEVDVISPYEANKRFIVEQFRTEVEEGTLLEDFSGEYHEKLTPFQEDAFRAARRPLDKYNGVVLADSVGLGKSYIGAPLVQEYTTSLDHVLIIAPRRLKNMWMDELLHNSSGEFPTAAQKTFISFNKLSRLSEQEIQQFREVDMILVDEAHKLRNKGTQRYDKLQSIGRSGKKFVFLTATPIHNSVRDVDNLIKLFADDSDFDILLGNKPPSEIFREYDRLSSEDDPTAETRRRLSDLEERIEEIMREVVISRDRHSILNNPDYDDLRIGDKEISVPERNPHLVTPDDPRLDDLYKEIVDTVLGTNHNADDGLNLPYVSAERYDLDGDDEEEVEIEYQNASVLMLINLLKRLESSLAAFEVSVENLIRREKITQKIANGDLEDAEGRQKAVAQIHNSFRSGGSKNVDFEEVADAIARVDSETRQEIVSDIDDDLERLQQLQKRAREVLSTDSSGGTHDAKASRLVSLLGNDLGDEKVLLFSQFVPTVEHLFEQITGESPKQTQIANAKQFNDATVAYVRGGDGFDEKIVERFAPESQDASIPEEDEIDILLATDVLSVGQNLQDARVLVNYDLHWNPMKMEQRVGRIDRITTNHDQLEIYSFVPTGELRQQLGLLSRIQDKIDDIANTFGHSAPIMDSAEEQVHKSMITYERLKEDGADFGDENLEGIGSKYDDLRSVVKRFCETYDVDIAELQETLTAVKTRDEPQHFVLPNKDSGIVTLVRLEYSSGREEWKATIFEEGKLQHKVIGGQAIFSKFPRRETDESTVFQEMESNDTTRKTPPEEDMELLKSFTQDIQDPNTWENSILNRSSDDRSVVKDIRALCQEFEDDDKVGTMCTEVLELLDSKEVSDWAATRLQTIYRRRRRYGSIGTIERIHHAVTEEIEFVEPERVIDVDVALAGIWRTD